MLQIGGTTRDVFYYPKDTVLVTCVGEKLSMSLMEQAGMQAQIPVQVQKQSPASLRFQVRIGPLLMSE